MIRKLNIDDLSLVKKILPPSKIDSFTTTYLTNLKTWFAFGFFKDGEIKGISTSYFNSTEALEWYLLTQYADCSLDMAEMVEEVCSHYEQQKIYKLFWLDADYYIDYLKNFIPDRYLHFKEYSSEPLMMPRTPRHYYVLYDQKMFLVNTHVYLSVLLDDYRK